MTHIYAKDLVLKAWNKVQGAMSPIGKVKEGCVPIMTFSKARHERLFPRAREMELDRFAVVCGAIYDMLERVHYIETRQEQQCLPLLDS
jgi:hypothetical protein